MPKVAIAMVTDGSIVGSAFQAVLSQTYLDTCFVLYMEKRRKLHPNPFLNRLQMIAVARNEARKMVLAMDCEFVWWVDSDTTPKENALELLMEADRDVVCGWYLGADGSGKWTCGWDNGGVVSYAEKVHDGLLKVDWCGLGCALMKRSALEAVAFDCPETFHLSESGERLATSDATYWTTEANRLGYGVYMHGDVVCEHKIK
jgi:fermentation-respiration switch protein FrsA (DUF1100 family)